MKRSNAGDYEILTVPFSPLSSDHTDPDLLDLGELQENQFRGMASVFGTVVDAYCPTIMQRGAFTKTLQERGRAVPILWQHDMWQPIGKPVRLFENDLGLVLQAQISRTTVGRDALILMRDQVVNALSIGFEPIVFDFEEGKDAEGFKTQTRYVREARLVEISVVTLGADANALINEVRSGFCSGSLERYRSGHGVVFGETAGEGTTQEVVTMKPTNSTVDKFTAFSAEYLLSNPDASEHNVAEAFATTLKEAEPVIEPLTLNSVEHQLQVAELLAAEMSLDLF